VAIGLAVFFLFYRSPHFFDGIALISSWQFLQPGDAVEALEDLAGFSLLPLSVAVIAVFPVVAVYWLIATARAFSIEHVLRSGLAIMATVLFAVTPHLWPWYLIWVLPLAALTPRWWLSRFVAGTAIVVPFSVAFWWIDALEAHREPAALAIYVAALLWIAVTRPPSAEPAGRPALTPDRSRSSHGGARP
jgi:alpha-1,6-mannosyltransferase